MIRGMSIILLFLVVGEGISFVLGIPVPGNVIGMILMTLALLSGIVKLDWIKDTADVLLKNMAFFFVPPGVGLILYFGIIRKNFLGITLALILGTLAVMFVVGHVQQKLGKKAGGS